MKVVYDYDWMDGKEPEYCDEYFVFHLRFLDADLKKLQDGEMLEIRLKNHSYEPRRLVG